MKNFEKNKICKSIMVSGANGFTGKLVCKELKNRGKIFSVILRPGTDTSWMISNKIPVFFANLNNVNELSYVLKDCECLINLASIGFGSADSIIKACEKVKIKRVIFISSTSIFTSLNSKSKNVRIKAEKSIKKSSLNWTILRPTMIYGNPNDRNMIRLIRWIDKYPILPIFGRGDYLQQPVNVNDLAWLIVEIIQNKKSYFEVFNVSGKTPLTFNEVIDYVSKGLNKKVIKIFLPYKFFARLFYILERLHISLPLKSEQILRINENKKFSHEKANAFFGFKPMDFEKGINVEIKKYKTFVEGKNILN